MRHGKGYIDLTEAEVRALHAFTADDDRGDFSEAIHVGAGWAIATDGHRLVCLGTHDPATYLASIDCSEFALLVKLATQSRSGHVRIGRMRRGHSIELRARPRFIAVQNLGDRDALATKAGHHGCAHRWSMDPILIGSLGLVLAAAGDTNGGFLWHAPATETDPIRITLGDWSVSIMPMAHPDNKQAAEERTNPI